MAASIRCQGTTFWSSLSSLISEHAPRARSSYSIYTWVPGLRVTHNYHRGLIPPREHDAAERPVIYGGVFQPLLKRGATTGPTIRMWTPRSVFSARWLNTLFHGDVLIARIHHVLLSRSFRLSPLSFPLAHLFRSANLPAVLNAVSAFPTSLLR